MTEPTSVAAAGWSALHYGIDPRSNRLLWWWLRLSWRVARPLVRMGVPPIVLTIAGVGLSAIAAGPRWSGHGHLVALLLLCAAVFCDGLDGAVAVLGDCSSNSGAQADKLADRLSDVAFVVVIWRSGAPWPLAVGAGAVMLAVEGLRELRGGSLRSVITIGERPSRWACVAIACVCASVSAATWPATVCACVLLVISAIAVVQLTRRGGVPAIRAHPDGDDDENGR